MLRTLIAVVLLWPVLVLGKGTPTIQTANASGEISIGTQGEVLQATLDPGHRLGESAQAGYLALLEGWRFEPVRDAQGEPWQVRARFSLWLMAVREGKAPARMVIDAVSFSDPGNEGEQRGPGFRTLAPPVYPPNPLQAGVGAQVFLMARIGADGEPVAVAADRVFLRGRSMAGSRQERFAGDFARAAERAVIARRYDEHAAGELIRVTINFTPDGDTRGWQRTFVIPIEVPAWVTEAATRGELPTVIDGESSDRRIHLLTALPPAI